VKSAGHTPKRSYVSQIVYPYGGIPLHKLVSVVDMFFPAFFLCAMTGYMNEIQKVYHTDIKEDNIMYNIVSQKFVLIDFGRTASDLRDITNTFVYTAFLKMLKKNNDPMFIFYTQLSPEVMYFCNMVRYISWNLSQNREISLLDFNEIFTRELSQRIKYINLEKVIKSFSDNYGSMLFPLYESFIHRVISTFKIHGSELDRLKSELTEKVVATVNHLVARQDIWGLSYTMYRFFKSKYGNDSRSLILTEFLNENVLSVPDAERPNLIDLHQMLCAKFSSFDKLFIPQYTEFIQKIYDTSSKSQNIVNNETQVIVQEKTYVENLIKSLSANITEPSQ
jgi:serine/threonine protein kinase